MERDQWISCKRGHFPDVPVPVNPDGSFQRVPVAELVIKAREHCGANCPPDCGYRKVVESLQNKIEASTKG